MELLVDAICLATAAVDMRTGTDGLSLHVQHSWGAWTDAWNSYMEGDTTSAEAG